MSLKKKTIHGLGWAFLSQGGKQGINFIITAILARLLTPNDFGLLGMVTVFTNLALIFNELGVSSALIQKQDVDDRHLSSAFWLNIIAGLFLALIFIAISPLIALFYKRPELKPILMVMSFNFILASFTIIQQAILTKDMDFRSLMIRDIIAVIIGGAVGIYLAYKGFGVWSLVYQLLTFTLANSILLWILSKWRPRFIFSPAAIKDIFHFSANVVGFNILNYFARNVDYLLIGRFLGAQSLGYYTLAYKLMMVPLQSITYLVSKVMFPAFSKIQHDLPKVQEVYMKMVKAISLITFPLVFCFFAIAPEFVLNIYGSKWEPATVILQILCVCGLLQSVSSTDGNILLSQGKANIQFRMQLSSAIIVFIAVAIGLKWGIIGVALMYAIQALFWTHFALFVAARTIKLSFGKLYNKILKSYLIGFIIMLGMFILKAVIFVPGLPKLAILISAGLISTVTLLILTKEIKFGKGSINFSFSN